MLFISACHTAWPHSSLCGTTLVVWLCPLNPAFGRHSFRHPISSGSSFPPIMPSPLRWLLLDTETHDLVAIHTDGNEQISVVSFSPGRPGVLGRQGLGD